MLYIRLEHNTGSINKISKLNRTNFFIRTFPWKLVKDALMRLKNYFFPLFGLGLHSTRGLRYILEVFGCAYYDKTVS